MRFWEFADTDEQLALLRLIVGNTWDALEQYAMEQRGFAVRRRKPAKRKRQVKRTRLALQPRDFRVPKPKILPKPKPPAPPIKAKPKPAPLPLQRITAIKPIAAFSLQQHAGNAVKPVDKGL